MNGRHFAVCGIVEIGGKILLVRHTYGTAKGRILVPGGYVREGEMPDRAVEREIYEETGVVCKARSLAALEMRPERWCAVFIMEHISGEPRSDGYENSEVLLLTAAEAAARPDITNMSRAMLSAYAEGRFACLEKTALYLPRLKRENTGFTDSEVTMEEKYL